ncbi:MAG: hypothetical protein ING22_06195 [Burkholderiales bacterium]|nr:hypothetical protein [Burkholderiales bacterium]
MSYALFEKMKDNYRVYLFENLHSDANRASELVAIQLAALKCNRVLQIGFLIDEDSAGPYFLFSVDLNKAVFVNRNSTGHTIRLESEFQKSYRYVRTGSSIVEFMDAPTDNFTNRVLTDFNQAGVLTRIKKDR